MNRFAIVHFAKAAMSAFAVAVATSLPAAAETHALRDYAYIQANGANRIDTEYCAKALSRYYIDYQLAANAKANGIFGDMGGSPITCAFYTVDSNTASSRIPTWYYRNSGSSKITWNGATSGDRRTATIVHGSESTETATLGVYGTASRTEQTSKQAHSGTNTSTINLFALNASGQYIAGTKKIYCFEAADTSDAVNPTIFLAPAKDENNAAGFLDVITGKFHGEAQSGVAKGKELVYSDGVGNASDYKYENGVFSAKFRAYASDDALGSVKFGDGEASGEIEAWVDRGETVTLTATPAAGCEFRGWTGDTWAIVSGSADDATITVKSDTAVQFLAEFGEAALHWTGAAGDGKWFTAGNWTDSSGAAASAIPDGAWFVFDQAGDAEVEWNPADESFAAGTVKFASGAGAVKVTGAKIASLGAVVCENGKENEFANEVAFSGSIDVTAKGEGFVRFSGGASGSNIANHTVLYGKYTVTATGDWTPPYAFTVKSGSEFNLPDGTWYDHIGKCTIESGATVTVKQTRSGSSGDKYMLAKNDGVFMAMEELYSGTELASSGAGGCRLQADTSGVGKFVAGKIRIAKNGVLLGVSGDAVAVLGEGGIFADGAGAYVRVWNVGTTSFGASADWSVRDGNDNAATTQMMIRRHDASSPGGAVVSFDTTDGLDDETPRRITCRAPMGGNNEAAAETMSVLVKGAGTFAFENTNAEVSNIFAGGVTARDTATVELAAGCVPGKGGVTLEGEATLKMRESGSVSVGGALAPGAGTTLAFNFTEKNAAPTLAVGSLVPPDEGTVAVRLTAADGVKVDGRDGFTLVAGARLEKANLARFALVDAPEWAGKLAVSSDGDLVLAPKSRGLVVTIR